MYPKLLIVGTVPYNKRSASRAFESYFSGWDRDRIRQIFSNTKKPAKGHCDELYQITDQRMLARWKGKKVETGIIYHYDDLADEWLSNDLEVNDPSVERLYRSGSKKSPLKHLLRGLLWKKKFWCTDHLNAWLDDYRPELVFLSFSDDFFINNIALYVARRFNIPIISSIGDDYYFNTKFSLNPAYLLYKGLYRRKIREVFAHGGSAIYIGDKIRDKYNAEFGLDGKTVYLTSDLERREFCPIHTQNPKICYFGNIRLGRNESLSEIATALGTINDSYRVDVFSNERYPEYIQILKENPHVCYNGSVPYSEVQRRMKECDLLLVVEGFSEENVNKTRYSLSTKVADTLSSGVCGFAYGSYDCGAIEYASQCGGMQVCTQRDSTALRQSLLSLLNSEELQKQYYDRAKAVAAQNHTLQNSTAIFLRLAQEVVARGRHPSEQST